MPGVGDSVKIVFTHIVFFMVFFLSASFVAVAQNEIEPLPCNVKQVGIDAAKFYIYLTQDTPYTSWVFWSGKNKLSPGKEPHGTFLTTYVNPAAHRSITGKERMAYGSLIVMENYDTEKKLTGLTVMLKIKGYNPQAGDWYWFHYDQKGTVLATGRVASCIDCHRSQSGNDYLMTAPVKR